MKKILIVLIIACMVVGLVACAKPTEQQIAEKVINEIAKNIDDAEDMFEDEDYEELSDEEAEEWVESFTDGDIDINEQEGTVTIGDGEDQVVFEGSESGMPWPGDELPANVPELKGVTVVSTMDTGDGILIGFEGCDAGEASAYREQIKSVGWNVMMDMSDDAGGMVMAGNDAGESLMFVWDTEEQGGAVTYSAAQ